MDLFITNSIYSAYPVYLIRTLDKKSYSMVIAPFDFADMLDLLDEEVDPYFCEFIRLETERRGIRIDINLCSGSDLKCEQEPDTTITISDENPYSIVDQRTHFEALEMVEDESLIWTKIDGYSDDHFLGTKDIDQEFDDLISEGKKHLSKREIQAISERTISGVVERVGLNLMMALDAKEHIDSDYEKAPF